MHDLSLVLTLAGALAVALALGWVTQRLGLSTLVGYLLAGIVVGPYTPGFVADRGLASDMAEIGVILLMFGVGMHFHPYELLRVWRLAVPGAIAQSALATGAGWGLGRVFGWSDLTGLVFGMSLAVASTVVLMRMLIENGRLASQDGHVAVGWLIVEDLFTVVALVMLPALAVPGQAGAATLLPSLGGALLKAGAFVALVWLVGSRLVARVLEPVARARSDELLTLAVFVVALGVALIAAQVFQVSVALGAFFAGLVVGRSRIGAQAAAYVTPFRDVFSALFFVSVGMLFDPGFLLAHPWRIAAGLGVVLIVKPFVAVAIVRLLGDRGPTGSTVAVGLAQIGEFSFILATVAVTLELLPAEALDLVVAVALISIALNPLLFRMLGRRRRAFAEAEAGDRARHDADARRVRAAAGIIACGSGPLFRALVARLAAEGAPVVVISPDLDAVQVFERDGVDAVFGHASQAEVLRAAGVEGARSLVVSGMPLTDKLAILVAARRLNGDLALVASADDAAERAWLQEFGVRVCVTPDPLVDAIVRAVRAVS